MKVERRADAGTLESCDKLREFRFAFLLSKFCPIGKSRMIGTELRVSLLCSLRTLPSPLFPPNDKMWAAIKTDLSEFLTSASAESESALNSLDQTIDSLDEKLNHSDVVDNENNAIDANDVYVHDYEETPDEEAVRLAGLPKTFIEPLVVEALDRSDTKEVSYETNDTSYESYDSDHDDEEVFEQRQIDQFLESFDIKSHADEIAELLHPVLPAVDSLDKDEQQNDSDSAQELHSEVAVAAAELTPLQIQYQQLVPQTITHQEFWTRYYFRCNPALISERNEHKRNLQERQRQLDLGALNEAAVNIGKSAVSLFKNVSGAMGAVGESLGEATRELRMHQSSGRPPFVTTALEEDDDEYIEGEEDANVEEDETSLGWDSDSEKEEVSIGGDGRSDEDDSIHDEVAFDTEASTPPTPLKLESIDVVKLRRTLMHAESERNNMMLMVEERNEEIMRLKCALEQKPQTNEQGTLGELEAEVKCLRNAVALKNAQVSVNELKTIIDAIKTANAASNLSTLLQEELSKQEILQQTLNEYEEKIKQLELQTQRADEHAALS
jgi:hypothetical protein